ncbi:OTU domain-containing protein 4-like isoform X2 [Sinocyclocheilus anshuiensis]|uniref:OTU domain-containing protein 4-like isoform X2 n=1 Tax=Sinocyclocheilus anshuiensis TaxID=1608454 RepID=UPI0007BA98CA|nr:PREDICTED: OTU domain-containing protein 4-like isoform X2 [Sinocyclocheilus anshuiensis]
MELREAPADAQQQLAADRTHESRMNEYLRSLGFYRKKIAKDGSCLFRAVAEQVLNCQALHTEVRAACVNYLRQNRSNYELFIEGNFEKYMENLQDPQSWVGQVEITALAELYKHDFVIFQETDQPPVNITENGFTKKVRLCFLNGNHYDNVYPQSFEKSAAVCQSILYELLYDRVCGAERSVLGSCMKGGKGRDKLDSEECKSSEESDLEEDEFWSSEAREKPSRPPQRGRGRGQSRGRGRDLLSTKAQRSLNPALYRNVEYDVWLRSKRLQQQRDFCMAVGMQYSVGDKCKVQLNNRFYNAYVQEVSPDNGPVTVFIGELNKQETVPLLSLRLPSEETQSWQPVAEKGKRHAAPNNSTQTSSEWESRGSRRSNKTPSQSAPSGRVHKQHSWPPQATPDDTRNKFRRSDQRSSPVCVLPEEKEESAILEILHKDEHNFPSLGTSPQTATASEVIKKGGEKRGSRKKDQKEHVSETETPQRPVQRQRSTTEEKQGIKVSEEPRQKPSLTIKEKVLEKPSPASLSPLPAVTVSSDPKTAPSSSQYESAKVPAPNQSAPEAIKKTPVPPKTSPARRPDNSQFAPVSTSAPSLSISVAGAVSRSTPAIIQSTPAPKSTQPLSQAVPVPTLLLPTPDLNSQPTQTASQITSVASQITPVEVAPAIPTQTTLAPSGLVPCASVEPTPSIQSAPPSSIFAPPCIPASAIPVSAPAQVPAPILDAPDQSSTTLPIDGSSGPPIAQKSVDPHTTVTPILLPHAPPTSISPSSGPAQAPPPDLPQSSLNESDPRPCETSAMPASSVAPASDPQSQPQQLPYPHVQWSQLLQDPVYPGFPKNEKGEVEPLPPYSFSQKGEDLPQDMNVLRFFFNLGVKAYSQPMFPPIVYLGALNQAYQMHLRGPPPSSDSPANPTVTSWQPENPSPPQNLRSIPDTSLDSHAPVAPVASGSGPVGPIELGAYNDHPVSIPMSLPPRPPMTWPVSSGPSSYAGSYPSGPPVHFSPPPYPPPGNQMYPPSSVGYHRMPFPMPLEALNHGPHGRMDVLPFVPPSVDRGQGNGQRSVNPQFGSLQKTAGDFKTVDIPVSVATMEPPPFTGPCSVVQPFPIGPLQGDMVGLTPFTNGNLGKQGGVFPQSHHAGPIAEDPSRSIHPYSPDDNWSVEEMEYPNVNLRATKSFYSQSYRGGGRRGQDDRGGYQGRGHRGQKNYSGRGRQDEQSSCRHFGRRGAGPRVVMQLPYP